MISQKKSLNHSCNLHDVANNINNNNNDNDNDNNNNNNNDNDNNDDNDNDNINNNNNDFFIITIILFNLKKKYVHNLQKYLK